MYVLSPELGLSHPLSPASVPLPPEPKGWAHLPAGDWLGGSQFGRLEKSLALCLLCVKEYVHCYLKREGLVDVLCTSNKKDTMHALIHRYIMTWGEKCLTNNRKVLEPATVLTVNINCVTYPHILYIPSLISKLTEAVLILRNWSLAENSSVELSEDLEVDWVKNW